MARERRKNFRVEWNSPATICDAEGGRERRCVLSDFSNVGGKITDVEPDTVPDEFLLRITPRGRMRKCRVLWRSRSSNALGVVFSDLFPTVEERPTGDVAREPTAP
jgi:PilZ domain-containing protein